MAGRKCNHCGSWKLLFIGELPSTLKYEYIKIYLCHNCGDFITFAKEFPDEKKKANKTSSVAKKQRRGRRKK